MLTHLLPGDNRREAAEKRSTLGEKNLDSCSSLLPTGPEALLSRLSLLAGTLPDAHFFTG